MIQGIDAWVRVNSVTAPAWDVGTGMLLASFDIDIDDPVRIKIEKVSVTGSTTVNIDNIIITEMTE